MTTIFRGCLQWRQSGNEPWSTLRMGLAANKGSRQRFFCSSGLLRASKNGKPTPSISKIAQKARSLAPPIRPPISGSSPVYQPFAVALARKAHPTTLYQAPSHTLFIVSSYGAAVLCFSYAAFNFYTNYIQAPDGLAPWVPLAFISVCFTASALGVWILFAPARLIRTITAIPKALPSTRIGARTNPAKVPQPELQIEIEMRKILPLPFLVNRKIYASPKELVLRRPLAPPELRLTPEELRQAQELEEEEKARQLEYERSHIMSAPFRHAGWAFSSLFKALGRSFFREGFEKVDVKGKTLKMDVTGGWALDGGRALDRLATVKSPF